jgi:hypothetical protein
LRDDDALSGNAQYHGAYHNIVLIPEVRVEVMLYPYKTLTSHPMFLIILSLTYKRATMVSNAAIVTVSVAPSMVGPWFSLGRKGIGGAWRCDRVSMLDWLINYELHWSQN